MRAFRISVVLFLLLLVLIGVSTAYGRRVCNELDASVKALSASPDEQTAASVAALKDYWQNQIPYLRPLVNRTVVRTMTDLLSDFTVYADPAMDSESDYRATREKVRVAIDEMRRSEKATFGLWS